MDTARILTELRAERDRIDQAIAALEALSRATSQPGSQPRRRGRKPSAAKQERTSATPAKQPKAGRRKLSAAARKRISDAAKRRWAAQKSKAGA